MKFFWVLVLITIAIATIQLIFYKSLEIIIGLFITDFIALWASLEIDKKNIKDDKIYNIKLKLENIEEKCYKILKNMGKKKKYKAGEILKWLNYF